MIPIELKKRYPHSRVEDITDAFMRGYQACAAQGGDAEMDNCQAQAPQNYMQQSRHNDGTDLISRADAIAYIDRVIKSGLGRHKSLDYIRKYISALPSADAVTMNNIQQLDAENGALKEMIKFYRNELDNALSADAVHGEWKFVDHEIFAGEYFCNICGKRANVDLYGEWILSNHCPSCGARMKGGAE